MIFFCYTLSMLKRVYIEIGNICNLHCSFCSYTTRKPEIMIPDFFETIVQQVKDYTDFIYLHVQGEPTLHPFFDDLLTICDAYAMKVQLVTNGTTLSKVHDVLLNHSCLRKISFSLQSIEFYQQNLDIFQSTLFHFLDACKEKKSPIIEVRFWRSDELKETRTKTILEHFHQQYTLTKTNRKNNYSIAENIYVDFDNMFEWPDDLSKPVSSKGKCLGAIQQIAVLSNGEVVPCCLDCNGMISFGNMHTHSIQEILHCERYVNMVKGLQKQTLIEPFCQKCTFRLRFNK